MSCDDLKHPEASLKATRLEVGLVMNFGPKPEFQRRVFDLKTGVDEVDDF